MRASPALQLCYSPLNGTTVSILPSTLARKTNNAFTILCQPLTSSTMSWPAVVLGLEHARTIASCGWTRNDIKSYLWLNSGNRFDAISRSHRYGKVYNRNLPKWYKREPDSRIPIVESADRIHLFVIGGHAGRFSAFIPGWGAHEHTSAATHRRSPTSVRRPLRRRHVQALRDVRESADAPR
jgi:hypothetical protein